jgi:hypothetical protein
LEFGNCAKALAGRVAARAVSAAKVESFICWYCIAVLAEVQQECAAFDSLQWFTEQMDESS